MNRSQLIKTVIGSTNATRSVVEDVVEAVFARIISEVKAGQRVAVAGFGTFTPTVRRPRVGRNPRTGTAVPIPASNGVRFATGSTFKQALNPKEEVPMAVSKAPAQKTVAKKAPAKKAPAKKAPAKKAPARR